MVAEEEKSPAISEKTDFLGRNEISPFPPNKKFQFLPYPVIFFKRFGARDYVFSVPKSEAKEPQNPQNHRVEALLNFKNSLQMSFV